MEPNKQTPHNTSAATEIICIPGVYVLTEKAMFGVYDKQGQFKTDLHLSENFLNYNTDYLKAHLQDSVNDANLIGVIVANDQHQKWRSQTLIFTDTIVRDLYRIHGDKNTALTPFQKRSRVNSVYRGIETLLEYRHENERGVPVYCPILYNRRSQLNEYISLFGRDLQGMDPNTPVIEVLNYIAPIASSKRTTFALANLMTAIHKSAIDTSLRKPSELELLDQGLAESSNSPSESEANFMSTQQLVDGDYGPSKVFSSSNTPSSGDDTEQSIGVESVERAAEKIEAPGSSSSLFNTTTNPEPDYENTPLFQDLYQDLLRDQLTLPSLPDVAIRIRRAIENGLPDVASIAKVIETDPAIAVKLLHVVNSPLYRGTTKVESCADAIVRLGMDNTKQIVTTFAVRELFHSKSPFLKDHMLALWRQSIEVASIAYVLGSITPGFDSEHALLCGLIHHIGEIPILAYADKYPEFIQNQEKFDQILEAMRGRIGELVLRKWEFAQEIIDAAAECDQWFRDAGEKPDYCDLVIISQLHSYVRKPGIKNKPAMNTVPAFSKLALGKLSPSLSLEILHEAEDQIEEVKRLLAI